MMMFQYAPEPVYDPDMDTTALEPNTDPLNIASSILI